MDWNDVKIKLARCWPSQVSTWGPGILDGYVNELAERGLSPEVAYAAVQEARGEFPPSAPALAAAARRDVLVPTFEEAYGMLTAMSFPRPVSGERLTGVLWQGSLFGLPQDAARVLRAHEFHPLLGSFVETFGLARLEEMPLEDPDDGHWRRKELREAWEAHVVGCDVREAREAALRSLGAAGFVDELRRRGGSQQMLQAIGDRPAGDAGPDTLPDRSTR